MDRPVTEISLPQWMMTDASRKVLAALQAEGAQVRFVGGCVRDALLEKPAKDLDIATPDRPEAVMALLEKAGLGVVPTGLAHGTVTAIADHQPFEITTLREDVESHGRRATVAFTADWRADAARRDLTFNALSCDPEGRVYDYFGGLADLREGRVRFVGRASERIGEDYLRLLRFFRFYAYYGRGPLDPEALDAASEAAPKLVQLSGERVREELLRLLGAPDPLPTLLVMRKRAILAQELPQAGDLDRLAGLLALPVDSDPLLRLAAWLYDGLETAQGVKQRLKLSKAQAARLERMLDPDLTVSRLDGPALRRMAYLEGRETVMDLLLLKAAEHKDLRAEALSSYEALASAALPDFPLQGRDLTELGFKPGPKIGQRLKEVENWWLDQDMRPDRQDCLERLKATLPPAAET